MKTCAWQRFLLCIALLASLTGLSACSRGEPIRARAHSSASVAAAPAHGKILYWKSPMNPNYISKTPGKDPMGMELVPVYAGQTPQGEPGVVRLDPATIQKIGVKTITVRRQALTHNIRTVGGVTYDDSTVRSISPKISGWVEQQHVNFAGQVVRRGEPLVSIYSPELVSTQQEYLLALRYEKQLRNSTLDGARADARDLVKSAEIRLRYWDISRAQIAALRERGKITRTMVLHAPFKGIVLTKNVLQGGHVQAGQSLYTLADISTVWVYADVYQYEAPWLKLGQSATMTLAYQPGLTYHGRVVYIYPYLNNKTRTLRVRMAFRNSLDLALKPGMWANVTLHSTITHEGLAVPVDAVIRTGNRNIVMVALGGGRFAPRTVKLGAEAGNRYEVLSGLHAGEKIVTSAEFLINSESSLQSALSKMTPPPVEKPAAKPTGRIPVSPPTVMPQGTSAAHQPPD